jgi:hypothetical protein
MYNGLEVAPEGVSDRSLPGIHRRASAVGTRNPTAEVSPRGTNLPSASHVVMDCAARQPTKGTGKPVPFAFLPC